MVTHNKKCIINKVLCRERDSNPHSHYWPRDFKSLVSTIPPSRQDMLPIFLCKGSFFILTNKPLLWYFAQFKIIVIKSWSIRLKRCRGAIRGEDALTYPMRWAVPTRHCKAHQFIRIIIFYKWSSENRFFSTKVSLAWKWRNYEPFFGKMLIIKRL